MLSLAVNAQRRGLTRTRHDLAQVAFSWFAVSVLIFMALTLGSRRPFFDHAKPSSYTSRASMMTEDRPEVEPRVPLPALLSCFRVVLLPAPLVSFVPLLVIVYRNPPTIYPVFGLRSPPFA